MALSLRNTQPVLDATGAVSKWRAGIWSHTHIKRPGWAEGINLLAAWHMDPPVAVPPPTVVLAALARIGVDLERDRALYTVSDGGVVCLGKGVKASL